MLGESDNKTSQSVIQLNNAPFHRILSPDGLPWLRSGSESTAHGVEVNMCAATDNNSTVSDNTQPAVRQALKYAEDIAKIYEQQKAKCLELEKANRELAQEVLARNKAETELMKARRTLEKSVQERTAELCIANELLQSEVEQRRDAETAISESLREKESLLQEIHHRVKNNLQIICSLISLQSRGVSDITVLGALQDTENRIRSMALIHEQLYRSDSYSVIDFHKYVENLIQALSPHNLKEQGSVKISTHVDQVQLEMKVALPCGLVINELVTNCLKHAFPGDHKGLIRIEFRKKQKDRLLLVVADNGVGLPVDFDPNRCATLGLQLVMNLVRLQLGGNVEFTVSNGTTVTIEL